MEQRVKRPRMRLDLPEDMIRAVKARAAFDGTDFTGVVTSALESYLSDELTRVREKLKSPSSKQRKSE